MEIHQHELHSPKPITTIKLYKPNKPFISKINWKNAPAHELVKHLTKHYTVSCIYHKHVVFAAPTT
jgi:hypothetical protein